MTVVITDGQTLLQAIYDLGVSRQTLLAAGGGFQLQIVAGPSGPREPPDSPGGWYSTPSTR